MEIQNVIPKMVSDAQNLMLCHVPTFDDIRSVIFDMDPNSALGPDGFNGVFFKHCWSIVGKDVCEAVRSFFIQAS